MSRIQDALADASTKRAAGSKSNPGPLTLLRTAADGDSVTADREQPCLFIGRGPTNDVSFDLFDDPNVSVRHAGVRLEEGQWVLYDMGSLNGTFLNEQPVDRCVLEPGDSIGLGRKGPRLRVRIAPPRPTNPVPAAGAPTAPKIVESPAETRESPIVTLEEAPPVAPRSRPWSRKDTLFAVLAVLLAVKIGLDFANILTSI